MELIFPPETSGYIRYTRRYNPDESTGLFLASNFWHVRNENLQKCMRSLPLVCLSVGPLLCSPLCNSSDTAERIFMIYVIEEFW
jgi:hypothetical protein